MTDQWNHGLKKKNAEMYSPNNEGKSVVAERFIRTLKKKIISIWIQYQKCAYW